MIYLSIIDHDGPDGRAAGLAELLAAADLEGAGFKGIRRQESGKPHLQFDPPQRCGFSLSKFRLGGTISAVLALNIAGEVGVDSEVWPARIVDFDFLTSIAGPDDQKAISALQAMGRDAGIALWAIKEAALKCCDMVATDPRHVGVTPTKAGLWRVLPGRLAGAPFPTMTVRLLSIDHATRGDLKTLVSVAVTSEKVSQIKVVTPSWNHSVIVT